MDSRRFDALTQTLAAASPRRGLLRLLGGLALGASIARVGGLDSVAKRRSMQNKKKKSLIRPEPATATCGGALRDPDEHLRQAGVLPGVPRRPRLPGQRQLRPGLRRRQLQQPGRRLLHLPRIRQRRGHPGLHPQGRRLRPDPRRLRAHRGLPTRPALPAYQLRRRRGTQHQALHGAMHRQRHLRGFGRLRGRHLRLRRRRHVLQPLSPPSANPTGVGSRPSRPRAAAPATSSAPRTTARGRSAWRSRGRSAPAARAGRRPSAPPRASRRAPGAGVDRPPPSCRRRIANADNPHSP